jgi:PAS domain S-box-containing protein
LAKLRGQGPFADNLRAQTVLEAVSKVSCAILIANNHGRYVTVNDDAIALTGYARSELLRMSVWDITPGTRAAQGRGLWREFMEMGRLRGVYEIRRKDGEHVRAEYVALANVLPGVHVSALVPIEIRKPTAPAKRSAKRR